MSSIKQQFTVSFRYDVHFTSSVFDPSNPLFSDVIGSGSTARSPENLNKVLIVLDKGFLKSHLGIFEKIKLYNKQYNKSFELISNPVIIPGGEEAKIKPEYAEQILNAINTSGIDRHSFLVVIGGGCVIDTAGYAAAIAHRGVRLIRLPTTVLAQNDAAIGVKNGINAYEKKNFIGTFAPPFAVINDSEFLKTLDARDWRSGISEAVKVALLKDPLFFDFIEKNAVALSNRDMESMKYLIYRCAELHLEHITTSGDPFETGSSRPLDFGHWAAHKLEQLTGFELRHGEAVAIGLALDVTYSYLKGDLSKTEWKRITQVLQQCGFTLFVPELRSRLDDPANKHSLLRGLEEFREHLGGQLTIMLLKGIGQGYEVNTADTNLYIKAIRLLEKMEKELV
ncbi:MAG: 3-dehydroquinate synthase [Balneolaceae bacterium]|nr:MAG: 3-dehydroquinate synthase [Balneolaceae bacterium]